MKKFAIIGISIVLLVAVVCVAAFAFWDTTEGNVTFEGSSIGSSITLKTTTDGVKYDEAEGAGKNLVASDAVLGNNDATLVCVGAVSISIDSKYNFSELQSLINSLTFNVKEFKVEDNSITKDNYSDTFTLYLAADKKGETPINAGADFHEKVENNYETGYTLYAFLKYNKVVEGANFANKAINITIQFVIA